jgi:predicted PhzF superfamily epimerase YddE/YHI9
VLLDGEGSITEGMQRFTRWTHRSEASFVLPHSELDADCRVRRFPIAAPTVPYPAHRTVKEGSFTKNLLLRDKKDRLFLFTVAEDRTLDLRRSTRKSARTGGSRSLRSASASARAPRTLPSKEGS